MGGIDDPRVAWADHRYTAAEASHIVANALGTKDYVRLRTVLAPDVDFRALTPNRNWEAHTPAEVEAIARQWLDENDVVDEVGRIEFGNVGDRERIGYRFVGSNPNGPFVMEQQAYLSSEGGRIRWMRVLCSGARPNPAHAAG